METNRKRWENLFIEAKRLTDLTHQLTDSLRPTRASKVGGGTEWEYNSRVWFRAVLPLIGGAPGIAFQCRIAHFAVETRAFLRDMRALREKPENCRIQNPESNIIYDREKLPTEFALSWQIFLAHYKIIRLALNQADLECEDIDCGPVDEITLPAIPDLLDAANLCFER